MSWLSALAATARGWFAGSPALPIPPAGEQGTTSWLATDRPSHTRGVAAGITPEQVTSAIEAAGRGEPRELLELLEDVEVRDAHLAGVLGVRRRALLTLPWHIEAPSDDPADVERARTAERLLATCGNLSAAIFDLSSAIYEGYHAAEILWAYTPAGEVYPRELAYRPSRWLRPDRDDPHTLRLLDNEDLVQGVELWPGKWIVHVARSRSRWPAMAGLGPTLLWLYLFKRYTLGDWVSYAERFGSPLRVGRYPQGTADPEIRKLADQLENLGIDAWAVIPQGFDVQFVTDGGARTGGDVYERLIQYVDRQISKLVLGQTLTTEAGATGTQALGTVHNEVRRDIRDGDAQELAGTLTRDLLTPLYRANFGVVPVGRWVFDVEPPADQKVLAEVEQQRAAVFAAARALGLTLSEAQLREELRVRAPEDEADTAAAPPAPAPFSGLMISGTDLAAFAAAAPTPAARLETLVTISAEDLRRAWGAVMSQVRRELGTDITAADVRARIPRILRSIDLSPYTDALLTSTLRAEGLGRLAVLPADQRAAGLPRTSPVTDAKGWAAALQISPAEWEARVTDHRQRAEDTTRYAMLRALQDVVAELDAAPADPAASDAERVTAALDRQAAAPSRTDAVAEGALGVAHGEGQVAGVATQRGLYFRYNTQRDDRVRPAHRAMDGKVFPTTHPIWKSWRPPNGYGCRCYLTVHTADEVAAAKWAISDEAPHLDGEPARPDAGWAVDTKAYDWSTFPAEWKAELDAAKAARRGR